MTSPELVALFETYTGGSDTIGVRLAQAHRDLAKDDPLIVATGRDIALFPGSGWPPEVESFRLGARGFKELTAISHLGPAVGSLVMIREMRGDDAWRRDGEQLLADVQKAREANSAGLWQDVLAVDAFRGMEQQIADMVDYSCAVTTRYLKRALSEEDYLSAETLHRDYLEGTPVPINHMMVATFFLAGMDAAHRVLRWLDEWDLDWPNAMVLIAGRQGRPTAGVTWNTSSVATFILGAARGKLPLERLYMAPHAPVFDTPVNGDVSHVAAMETGLRTLWSSIRATVELGGTMFPGHPRFEPDGHTTSVIHSANDFEALVGRLRLVLEDPRQLLSAAVTDFAVEQLVANDNDPAKVIVPGLTGVHYPAQN
ncbi:DUF5624 domain-containing protein [Lentzea sp. NPDC051213]|uniref:DUF5624 domain-containing protein n=1 Tax=Lentzea sp. NPDC051213 TaxID=3364126 RepID=UPI00379619F0